MGGFFVAGSASAATITVNKACSPTNDPGLFNLRIDGVTYGANKPCGGTTGAITVGVGIHTVSETAGTGTILTNYFPTFSGACNVAGQVIISNPSDAVTCTITNTNIAPLGTLVVIKNVVNDNGGTLTASNFIVHVKTQGPPPTDIVGSPAAGVASPGRTYSNLLPGQYIVSEDTLDTGFYALTSMSGDCKLETGGVVQVVGGQTKTCTLHNNDVPPILILDKVVSGGPPNQESNWTLTATGPTTLSGAGASGSADVVSSAGFSAGTYTLSESGGLPGYTASNWSCVGGIQNGNQITIGLNEVVVCTITNTLVAPTADNLSALLDNGCLGGFYNFSWIYNLNNPSGPNQSQFMFQVDNNSDFSSPEIDRTYSTSVASGTEQQQTAIVQLSAGSDVIQFGVLYYWRVKVFDAYSDSGWVSGSSFTPSGYPYPISLFTVSADSPNPRNLSFTRNDTCYNASGTTACTSYLWDFGDGSATSSSSTIPVNHLYPADGTYDASLQVTDGGGQACIFIDEVQIGPGVGSPLWKDVTPLEE